MSGGWLGVNILYYKPEDFVNGLMGVGRMFGDTLPPLPVLGLCLFTFFNNGCCCFRLAQLSFKLEVLRPDISNVPAQGDCSLEPATRLVHFPVRLSTEQQPQTSNSLWNCRLAHYHADNAANGVDKLSLATSHLWVQAFTCRSGCTMSCAYW